MDSIYYHVTHRFLRKEFLIDSALNTVLYSVFFPTEKEQTLSHVNNPLVHTKEKASEKIERIHIDCA